MALESMSDQARIWRLVASHAWRATLRWMHGGPASAFAPFNAVPARLLIAPQDLRTADPTIAVDIYAGRFVFSGHFVEAGGQSPFEVNPPSPDWARALHGFGWLRHLRAAETAMARSNARALIDEWIRLVGRRHAYAWEPGVVARRVLSWLSQSPLLLENCDRDFYRRFLKSLSRQVRFLRKTVNEAPDGQPRLLVTMAIAAASISMSGQGRFARLSQKRLDQELARQILPDGGHISRNPGAVLEILTDLLPIRQAFTSQGQPPSQAVMDAVDRMMPMIRFFRMGDGSFAHFNGMGATSGDLVATVLAYDDARGTPPADAAHSGYQRLVAADTLMVMDTGRPPPPTISQLAHAGCLSFEMSSGRNSIVVNCGVSGKGHETWRKVARSTAAHSTLEYNSTSSCRFMAGDQLTRWLGSLIVAGPTSVPVTREEDDAGIHITASHNGYAPQRVRHERSIRLARDGSVLEGCDRLEPVGTLASGDHDRYVVRFHLHPGIKASLVRGGGAVLLMCADGEAWEFTAPDAQVSLEESIYLSDVHGHRHTEQIVIHERLRHRRDVAWVFRRTATAKPQRRRGQADEDAVETLI
ncbi:putative heparinase superfamily protein [Breoghania corrubedonensis]|uniref:Putative heparinase superfamily protein n=1 Tax=Breoghania corrubedonensis TaxID=665038 RepID=A0A2T5VAW4_9HYPH|nr:heparinase II/III family protein [Breoghania corrubedonensis]PTW60885.1 putative heparinase superfamily protein [Breoghania corrubedonensis]